VVAGHRIGPDRPELVVHELAELGDSHASTLTAARPPTGARAAGTVSGMAVLLAAGDPTGFSSPLGQAVVVLALLTSLTLLVRWWWQQRRR
jgi:membrane-associated phospholipid phosphatase